MVKIDIFSGFLGAGKTTLIQKLIKEAFQGEKLVLIENEFGEIGIDGGFLKEAGIEITEMNSGCICCSLVGDFQEALKKVLEDIKPDRILIEPSGVGKLSDVISAVKAVEKDTDAILNHFVTIVDVQKCKMYMKNFGEFFNDQITYAKTIILSRTQNVSEKKINEVIALLKEKNHEARILTTPWDTLETSKIIEAMEASSLTLSEELFTHEHHHHHHADEVFTSWGLETPAVYTKNEIVQILAELDKEEEYGIVLRAKGMVAGAEGSWIYFDYVPEESNVRDGKPGVTGKFCVIGSGLKEEKLAALFGK